MYVHHPPTYGSLDRTFCATKLQELRELQMRQAAIKRLRVLYSRWKLLLFLPINMVGGRRSLQITGGASFLTEFEVFRTDGDLNQKINIDCEVFLNLADQHLQLWADWDYQCCWYYPDGRPNIGRQKAYSRPYARATAGTPISMGFNSTTRIFELSYRPNRFACGPYITSCKTD
jgi:hypothetical protein